MPVHLNILPTKQTLGAAAAAAAAACIRAALHRNEEVAIVVATGASQFEILDHLVREPDLDWSCVTAFHLDEYIGMASDHPASFRRYLKNRFVDRLPHPIGTFHYINPDEDAEGECARLNALLAATTIDVACMGIGENGHLAFNDPPADFETEAPYLIVHLDDACRRQQWSEGWFDTLEDVPRRAISMSISQIMQAQTIVCTVSDRRKAAAVQAAVEGPITPDVPASILQRHPDAHLFLDPPAASQLSSA